MNEWVSAQAERPRVSDLPQHNRPTVMQTTCDVTKAQSPPLGSSANPHVTRSAPWGAGPCAGVLWHPENKSGISREGGASQVA